MAQLVECNFNLGSKDCNLRSAVAQLVECYRPPDKSVYLKIIFLVFQPKQMLWVLKRTVSMRQFF